MIKLILISLLLSQPEIEQRFSEIREGHVLAWARHKTGYNEDDEFKSVATIPGSDGEDEIWVVVDRTIDGNDYTFIEQFQPRDFGDQNDAWFVDCGLNFYDDVNDDIWVPPVPATPEVLGDYPTLRTTDDQADPGLTHDIPISNYTELAAINANYKTGGVFGTVSVNLYLTGNIDASASDDGGQGFVPIGGTLGSFSGQFDGCGFTISNLYLSRPGGGLFQKLDGSAKVANLTLANVNYINGGFTGGIAGWVNCTTGNILIQNCHTSGNITSFNVGVESRYGGIVGEARGNAYRVQIYDCSSSVNLSIAANATIGRWVGGLVGAANDSDINNCFATGDVSGSAPRVVEIGGFVGVVGTDVKIEYCYSTGDVQGTNSGGGFVGLVKHEGNWGDMYIRKCYSTSDVILTGQKISGGGFVGYLDEENSEITDCYAWGDVYMPGGSIVGGFAGNAYDDPNVSQVYSIGVPTGDTRVGGLVGYNGLTSDPDFSDTYWDTETSGTETSDEGVGHTTTWLKTNPNYPDSWDFDTIWFQEYSPATPEIPGYWLTGEWTHLGNDMEVCVYADGVPLGTYYIVDGDIDGLDESLYTTIIAGINYYSTYESFPLELGNESNIHNVTIDFLETLGCHVGVSRSNSTDWQFSEDDFATRLDMVTEIKEAPFFWGSSLEPVVHLWTWIPVPNTVRNIITKMKVEE